MKPLSYFANNPLFADMEQAWGSSFEKLSKAQIQWIFSETASDIFYDNPNRLDEREHDDEITEAVDSFSDVSTEDKINLLKFMVNLL